ncbi:uncharacterized protein [Coffea arabica]|uniref:Endonuclease/exonuclease/phosphatase domain-containing protein n=1 Tax=Coffea arabica TaxID=13443 RepID=A0ABM4UEL5_COFAR
MRALVWNCRGVGSPLTVPQLKEAVLLHFPSLVFLSETKNKKSVLNSVKQKIKFDNLFVVDPVGLAGGLAVLWKEEVKVKQVLFTTFTIELLIVDSDTSLEWWCVCIYASPDASIRKAQWEVINRRRQIWGEAWVVMGDMNDIVSQGEKWGGRDRADNSFNTFRAFINNNELVDIGYEGKPWTWCNRWDNEGEIRECLDRVLGSGSWCNHYRNASCRHLETEASDHCMLLVDTKPATGRRWKKRFVFNKNWIQHKECRVELLRWHKQKGRNSGRVISQTKKEIKELKESNVSGKGVKLVALKRRANNFVLAVEAVEFNACH